MNLQSIRAELEKIAWKHYNPEESIDVEKMLDEMMPVVERMLEETTSQIVSKQSYNL